MLDNLLSRSKRQKPEVGRVFTLGSESYLITTPVFQNREELMSRARENNLLDFTSFKILSYQPNILANKRYTGLLKVDRIEVAGLLKVLEEKLVVRFDGEYSTRQLSLERFEEQEGRLLIRDQDNNLIGVYHDSSGTFLKSPDGEDYNPEAEVDKLDKNAFRHGTIMAPEESRSNNSWNGSRRDHESIGEVTQENGGVLNKARDLLSDAAS
jgi:hypothetical protein